MIIMIMIIIGGLFLKPIQMSICLCFKLSYTRVHLSVCLSHHQILQKNYCHSWFQRGEDTGLFPKFIHCPCVCSCWLCSLLVTWLSLFTWKKVSRQYRAFVLQIQKSIRLFTLLPIKWMKSTIMYRLISGWSTQSLSGSQPIEDSHPMSCLPG